MTGRATPALLTELWHATKDSLTASLRGGKVASGELLGVARRFLRDNGQLGAPDEASRADLERLHRLYRRRLLEALDQPEPPSVLLAEARQYWTHHAPTKGAQTATHTAEELLALDVPFPKQ